MDKGSRLLMLEEDSRALERTFAGLRKRLDDMEAGMDVMATDLRGVRSELDDAERPAR